MMTGARGLLVLAVLLSACGGAGSGAYGGAVKVSATPAYATYATSAATEPPKDYGYGSSSGGAISTGVPAAAASAGGASVSIRGFAFNPVTLELARGTKVVWTNNDATAHTVTSGAARTKDGKFDQRVEPAASFAFTFNDAGTFSYFCSIHGSMTATVVVK